LFDLLWIAYLPGTAFYSSFEAPQAGMGKVGLLRYELRDA
jgi:hypothetical protein